MQHSTAGSICDRETGYPDIWEGTHFHCLCIWECSLYIEAQTLELGSDRSLSEIIPGRPWAGSVLVFAPQEQSQVVYELQCSYEPIYLCTHTDRLCLSPFPWPPKSWPDHQGSWLQTHFNDCVVTQASTGSVSPDESKGVVAVSLHSTQCILHNH